jgi:FixJ family two-component response regulator
MDLREQMSEAVPRPAVYLLDAEPRDLHSLSQLLADAGFDAVACRSAAAFFASFKPDRIGCLVLDLALGDADGLAIQQEICDRGLTLPLVFLSGCRDVSTGVRAMKAGALDFLVKPVDSDALLMAVRAGIALDLARRLVATEERRLMEQLETLTRREQEVLPYLVSGMCTKQIAGVLGVVEKTVKVHKSHVKEKLGTRSMPEFVRLADRLLSLPRAPALRRLDVEDRFTRTG